MEMSSSSSSSSSAAAAKADAAAATKAALLSYYNNHSHCNAGDDAGPLCVIGLRFWPSDFELLRYYLANKVLGYPLPCYQVKNIDIYLYDPDQLPIDIQDSEQKWAYFFLFRTTKSRRTPHGYWRAVGKEEAVDDEDEDRIIGFVRSFVFYSGKGKDAKKTCWKMEEYWLNPYLQEFKNTSDPKMNDLVACYVHAELAALDYQNKEGNMEGYEKTLGDNDHFGCCNTFNDNVGCGNWNNSLSDRDRIRRKRSMIKKKRPIIKGPAESFCNSST